MDRQYVGQLLDRAVAKAYAVRVSRARSTTMIAESFPCQLDVTDPASIAAAAAIVTDVGVLIDDAGIARMAPALKRDSTAVREELETNLFVALAMSATANATATSTTPGFRHIVPGRASACSWQCGGQGI